MSEQKTQSQANQDVKQTSPSYSGAIILILLGILFLLNNFGILPWPVWQIIVRYWPVVLILVGLEVILGGTWLGNLIFGLLGLLFFVGIFFFLLWVFDSQLNINLIQLVNQWLSVISLGSFFN